MAIPPAKSLHNNVATRVVRALQKVEQRAGGEARAEAGFLLSTNPTTIRQPDVALVSTEQIAGSSQDEYFHGAPPLAVEEVSPHDDLGQLDRKVEQYLRTGAKVVWVVFPTHKRIRIYRADGTSTVVHEGENIAAPELFPGWSLPVSEIFG